MNKNTSLILTLGHLESGNLTECSLCGKNIKEDEDYFDYDYHGHAEIVHQRCVDKAMKEVEE